MKRKLNAAMKKMHYGLWMLPATSQAASIQSILDKSASFLSGGLARSVGIVVIKNIPNSPNQIIWGVRCYEPF